MIETLRVWVSKMKLVSIILFTNINVSSAIKRKEKDKKRFSFIYIYTNIGILEYYNFINIINLLTSSHHKWTQMIETLRIVWVSKMKLVSIILFTDINVSCKKRKEKDKKRFSLKIHLYLYEYSNITNILIL